jgi:hypothetical protein
LRLEAELVAIPGIGHRFRTLDDLQSQVQRIAAEDVSHVVAADDDHLEPGFVGNCLEAGGAHFARRSDREAVAGDDKGLAAVNARAEVGHQIPERPGLPAFVERIEAFGDAVGRGSDLIRIDRVELLFLAENLQIPDDQRATANDGGGGGLLDRRRGRRDLFSGHARLQPGGFDLMHA